jgi:peptide deformylase
MKLFKIVKDDKRSLHERSTPIEMPMSDELKATLKDMLEYLKLSQDEKFAEEHDIRGGVGLAAPQIGINKDMLAIYYEDDKNVKHEYMLVNPVIVSESVKRAYLGNGEGCLSVDKPHEGYVYRAYKVTVKAYDLCTEKDVLYVFVGYPAIIVQHEIDHLRGVLFYDRIDKLDPFKKDPSAVEL